MTAPLFLVFVALMAAVVIMLSMRYLEGRTAMAILIGLVTWLLYAGAMSYFGVVRNTAMRPPGIAFIFVPIVIVLILLIVKAGTALAIPLWILLGLQSFRVVVELFLHQLWTEGLIPKMLTFEGANVDIFIGASAPLIAWLAARTRVGLKVALIWNVLGLCALMNVVVRAVLTFPGPLHRIHTAVPNQMIGTFPFTFIAAFFVPLAFVLHILAIRSIRSGRY